MVGFWGGGSCGGGGDGEDGCGVETRVWSASERLSLELDCGGGTGVSGDLEVQSQPIVGSLRSLVVVDFECGGEC